MGADRERTRSEGRLIRRPPGPPGGHSPRQENCPVKSVQHRDFYTTYDVVVASRCGFGPAIRLMQYRSVCALVFIRVRSDKAPRTCPHPVQYGQWIYSAADCKAAPYAFDREFRRW
jgi:hypothetical protein